MYNREKFLHFIETDMFLKYTWERRQQEVPQNQLESTLRAMFNSYVKDDSVMLREYEALV